MLDFTETIPIRASPARVWATLLDIERWWPPSNSEHESIERLDGADQDVETGQPVEIAVGTRFRIREKITGAPGEGVGVVTGVVPGRAVTWEADAMHYRLYGVRFIIAEGVTWSVDPHEPETGLLSARVWARFPEGLVGRILWLVFSRPSQPRRTRPSPRSGGTEIPQEDDRVHARTMNS
jgi:hypothetical protein